MEKKAIISSIDVINAQLRAIDRELHQLRTYELIERLPGEPAQAGDIFRNYEAFGKPMCSVFRKVYFNRSEKEMKHIASLKRKKARLETVVRNLGKMLADKGRPAWTPPVEIKENKEVVMKDDKQPNMADWVKNPEVRDIEVKVPFETGHLVLKMTDKEKDKFDLLMNKLATDDIRECEKEIRETKMLLEHMKQETREAKRIADRKMIADYNYIISLPKASREEIHATNCVNAVLDDMRKTGSILPNCKMCREKFGVTDQHRCDVCAAARKDILTKNLNNIMDPEIKRPIPAFVDGIPVVEYTKQELLAKYKKVDTGVRVVYVKIEEGKNMEQRRWFLKGLNDEEREQRLEWFVLNTMSIWQSYPGLDEYRDAVVMMKSILSTAYHRMYEDIHCNTRNVFKKIIEPLVNARTGIDRNPWTTKMVEISAEEKESFYDNKELLVKKDDLGNEHYFVRKFCKKYELVDLEQKFKDMNHADEDTQEGELRGMAYYSECPYMENGYLMESFIKYYKQYGRPYIDILHAFRNRYDRSTTAYSRSWAEKNLKSFFIGALGFLGLDKEDYFFHSVGKNTFFRTRKALEFYAYLEYLSKAMENKECSSIKEFFKVNDNTIEEYFKKYSITSELMG